MQDDEYLDYNMSPQMHPFIDNDEICYENEYLPDVRNICTCEIGHASLPTQGFENHFWSPTEEVSYH
jgi:hypothetical protein